MIFSRPIFDFLLGIALITLLDSFGAILSNKFNFRYISLLPLSLAIYILTGHLIGKTGNYLTMCLYTGLLGLFDATVGLRLSIYFNANMGLTKEQVDRIGSSKTSFFMIIAGWLFGSLGFLIS